MKAECVVKRGWEKGRDGGRERGRERGREERECQLVPLVAVQSRRDGEGTVQEEGRVWVR